MRSSLLVLVVALALCARIAPAAAEPARDPRALAVVERMLRAIGGADAPYRTDSIAFTFAVEKDGALAASRRHLWRPRSGEHRLEGTSADGSPFVVEWNLETRTGRASEAGRELEGPARDALLERAGKMWVNDTYWLLMPYKLLDPGVNLADAGEATIEGRLFDKVRVTFDQVGLTPGDTYWAFIARDTGLMERWAFVLQGTEPPPVEFRWTHHVQRGPLTLSQRKGKIGAAQAVLTYDIDVR